MDSNPRKKWRRRLRKGLKSAAILALGLFVLNVIVDNPYTHRIVGRTIDRVVRANTHLTVGFQSMKVSVAPPGVDLYGVKVATDVNPQDYLLTVARARCRLSLWAIFLGDVRLSLIELSEVSAQWPPPEDFTSFLKGPPSSAPPSALSKAPTLWPPTFALPVDQIVLRDAKAVLEIPLASDTEGVADNLVTAVSGVDVDFSFKTWTDSEATIEIRHLDLLAGARSMVEDTAVSAELALDRDGVQIERLDVKGERVQFAGLGRALIRRQGTPETLHSVAIKLAGDAGADISLLGTYLDIGDTHGKLDGSVQVAVDIPSEGEVTWSVRGTGKSRDAWLAGFRLLDSTTSYEVDADGLTFPELSIEVGDKVFAKGRGLVKFDDPLTFDFHAAPADLPLITLLDALGVEFNLVDTKIQSPDLRIFGTGMPFALYVTASAQFTDVSLPMTPYDRRGFNDSPACRLDFHLAVTNTQLDFGGTHGHCFQMTANTPVPTVAEQVNTAPPGAFGSSPVSLAGQVFFDAEKGMALDIHSPSLDLVLGQHFATIPLAGTGEVVTRIHGPFSGIVIDAALKARDVEVMGMSLGAVTGAVSVDTTRVTWKNVRAEPPGGGLAIAKKGELDFAAEPMQLSFDLNATDLGPTATAGILSPFVDDAAIGVEKLQATYSGPLLAPLAGQGQVSALLRESHLGPEPLFDRAEISLKAKASGWTLEQGNFALGTLRLKTTGRHSRRQPWAPNTEASESAGTLAALGIADDDEVSLVIAIHDDGDQGSDGRRETKDKRDHLQHLPFAGSYLAKAQIAGVIDLKAKVSGRVANLQGTFDGRVSQLSAFGSPMPPVFAKGFLQQSKIDVVFDHAGNAFEGRLSVDVGAPRVPFEWFFNFNRFDLRALATRYFHRDPRNYLYLGAAWHLKGYFADWWRATGDLVISDVRGKFATDVGTETKSLAIKLEEPTTVLFTKDGWRFADDRDLYLADKYTQLHISMEDNRPPSHLGIAAEGVVDLAIVRELLPGVDTATGKLHFSGQISGSVDDPKIKFEIVDLKENALTSSTWNSVSLGFADVRPPFRNVKLHVIYDHGVLTIDSFSADKGAGTVSAQGSLALDQSSSDSHVDIRFTDATMINQVAFLKSFETQLTGNLTVTPGTEAPIRIRGDITVARARSTREVDIRNEIINALRQRSLTTNLVQETPTIELDLNIKADQTINIHNRNLQTLLSSDLVVKGTDIAPSVAGQVKVDKGRFIYKRDFQIVRGLVTFDDPVKPDPSLDILAVSEVDAYRIYITIAGRASNPTVEFSVDPPTRPSGSAISKLEILVLLSRGKLPEETRSLGEETQKAAASEAANLILGQFEEPVEKLFDLSGQSVVRNVYIDTHPSESGSPVPRLNLPLDLGEDFDVVVRSDQDTNEVSTEYNVHENITFSGALERSRQREAATSGNSESNLDGDARVNLKFRFSFE